MTRALLVTLALGLVVCAGSSPAAAGAALIETTAPLADRSEESVKAAVMAAINQAVRGAAAMGFEWFELRDAQVSGNEVAVQILATNDAPDEAAELDGNQDEERAEKINPARRIPATSRTSI